MSASAASRVVVVCALAASASAPAAAAPVLRSATVEIRFTAPTACDVSLAVTVDGATTVEHRLEVLPGGRARLVDVQRAAIAAAAADVGRTRALVVEPAGGEYTLRYAVEQPPDRPFRCPVWLPAAPADGRSRNVVLRVALPAGARAAGTLPAFAWNGALGEATMGHLPAFVLVPYAEPGQPVPWDISRVMDGFTVAALVAGSLLWLRRARAGTAPAGGH
ncbi:MAG: hypothetical protein R2745_19205 [Vicinamibacterales bacterium]